MSRSASTPRGRDRELPIQIIRLGRIAAWAPIGRGPPAILHAATQKESGLPLAIRKVCVARFAWTVQILYLRTELLVARRATPLCSIHL